MPYIFLIKMVIDSDVTDHVTGNSSLLSSFRSHPTSSTVTLADGSTSCVMGSSTANTTSSISFSSILCLSKFSFNLLSVSKLTRALYCSVFFFPNYCLFQDLTTK